MLSTMPIFMVLLLLLLPVIAKGSYQVVWKVRWEFGDLESKLNGWKLQWRNTEVVFGPSKFVRTMSKLSVPPLMVHASFGILRTSPDCLLSSNQLCSSKFSTTLMKANYWLPAPTERYERFWGKEFIKKSLDYLLGYFWWYSN